ncbi:MAG: hypothetical protein L0Y56_16755, partial [Nitrospira sp.]|nr:hypothetical protein [Nitrospira sp.]
MGQIKYDAQNPNRHRELIGVRVFEDPGTLRPGYYVEETQDSTGVADFSQNGILGVGNNSLLFLDTSNSDGYAWDGTKWGTANGLTGVSWPALTYSIAGDDDFVYFAENNDADVWAWSGSGNPTQLDDGLMPNTPRFFAVLNPYLYIYYPAEAEVYELAVSGAAPEVLIADVDQASNYGTGSKMVPLSGKVYVAVPGDNETNVWEIIPTSAAGTGFGSRIASLFGFKVVNMWSHSGLLFMIGHETGYTDWAILYIDPQGTYGTLGRLPDFTGTAAAPLANQNGSFLSHYFGMPSLASVPQPIFVVDSVSGGFACIAYNEDGDSPDSAATKSMVTFNVSIFAT